MPWGLDLVRWSSLQGAFYASCLLHGLVWLAWGVGPQRESVECCGVTAATGSSDAAPASLQALQVSFRLISPALQPHMAGLNADDGKALPQSDAQAVQGTSVPTESGTAGDRTAPGAQTLGTEFGTIRTHFYDRSELNRFPVLEKPIRFEYEALTPDELQRGHADLWLFISASGRVVAVRAEFNTLTPATLQVVFNGLKNARFLPGYNSGNPVPSKIRWRIAVENTTGFTTASGE